MDSDDKVYSLPRWRITRWLTATDDDIPHDIRVALILGLFGTLPIFVAGVLNTLAVSAVVALRMRTTVFIAWFVFELVVCLARLIVLVAADRAARKGRHTPTDLHLLLAIAWSMSVGYGVLVSMASGDWVTATVASLSAAAMVGGICIRNFSAPRLAAAMIATSLAPCLIGVGLSGEPLLYIVFLQGPLYLLAMTAASFRLNKMLVATMRAERQSAWRARHDALTGLPNRTALAVEIAARSDTAARNGRMLALLFLDLDDFKAVNDTLGHAAGDRMICAVADRLRHMLQPQGLAARIGGDEFVVLAEVSADREAIAIGGGIVAAFAAGAGLEARVGVTVGIALSPQHGTTLEDLLAAADAALYKAKSDGKSRCCMGSLETGVAALRRMQGRSTSLSGEHRSSAA
jgi:diguanylate cyclase (GGDEF)-like protein